MRNKIPKLIIAVLIFFAVISVFYIKAKASRGDNGLIIQEVSPVKGSIEKTISSTGTVLPKNRLEIMPPINGRVEDVRVKEGQIVKIGDLLAEMSSTERAALLDAARAQGEEALKYWKDVYKAILLVSPINGEVIVATTQPGQTVTTADAVVVLSDHLIVRAQVDETDIGKVKLDQKAVLILDAYPDVKIDAAVEHIYYESETVNNVTVYNVDLLPDKTPSFFRSGMNATVNFSGQPDGGALLIPSEAVVPQGDQVYCYVKENGQWVKRMLTLGASDEKNTEVVSGLDATDTVMLKVKKYVLPKGETAKNPFMPQRFRSEAKKQQPPQ